MKPFPREEWGEKRAALPVEPGAIRARGEGESAGVCLEVRGPLWNWTVALACAGHPGRGGHLKQYRT